MTPEQAKNLKYGDLVTLVGTSPGSRTGHSDYDCVGKVERPVGDQELKKAFGGSGYYWIHVRVHGGSPQVWPTNRVKMGSVARPLKSTH